MSGFTGDSWILTAASAFSLSPFVFWLKYMKKVWINVDTGLEKRGMFC